MVRRGRRSGLRYAFEVYGAVSRSLGATLSYCGSRAPQMAAQEGALSRFFSFSGHFQPRHSLELPTPVVFFRLPVWQAAFGRRIPRPRIRSRAIQPCPPHLHRVLGHSTRRDLSDLSSGSSAQFCRCALFYDKRPRLQVEILSVLFIPNPSLFCRVQHRLEGKRQLAPAGLSGAAYCRPYVLSIPALQKRAKVQNCPAQDVSFLRLWLACPLSVRTFPYGAGDTLCSGNQVGHWVAGIGQDLRARESDHRDREG